MPCDNIVIIQQLLRLKFRTQVTVLKRSIAWDQRKLTNFVITYIYKTAFLGVVGRLLFLPP